MPWVRKMFRGGKVWAEADEQGHLVDRSGKVKIRYRQEDDREYSARSQDLEDIDPARLKAATTRPRRAKESEPGDSASPGPAAQRAPRKARKKKASSSATDGPGTLVVHTDGACYGNPGPAGIGVRMEWQGKVKELSEFLGEGTNNIAELTAIERALLSIKRRNVPVRLYTDSAYSIGVLTEGWKARANLELVHRIQRLIAQFSDLELRKVRGHSGDPHNERVDELARDAIDRQS